MYFMCGILVCFPKYGHILYLYGSVGTTELILPAYIERSNVSSPTFVGSFKRGSIVFNVVILLFPLPADEGRLFVWNFCNGEQFKCCSTVEN